MRALSGAVSARFHDRREETTGFDIPEKPLTVSEHRAAIYGCAAFGQRTRADFPEGVNSPAQYGERLKAAAIYLNAQQLVPEERTAQIFQDLFGATAAYCASVASWVRRKAQVLEPVYRAIGKRGGSLIGMIANVSN